jgi:transcription antitermination factor NusG
MNWVVAAVMSRREDKALRELGRAGFDATPDVYMPVIENRAKAAVQPLFPGYLFIRADRLRDVPRGGHVLGVLRNGEMPATVPQDVIDELQRREGADGVIRFPKRRRRFRAGKLVRASNSSPLSGLEAIVTRVDGRDRVVALFDLLGRKTPVTLSEADLTEIN